MPYPSSTLSTQVTQLPTFFEAAYADLQSQFVASRVFPVMSVPKQSGTFGKMPLEEIAKKNIDIVRAPGAGYTTDESKFSFDTYATVEYGVQEKVDDRERQMYRDFLEAEGFAAARAVNKLLTAMEARVAAIVFNTTLYTSATEQGKGNGAWDTAGGTPVTDVNAACNKFYDNTGLWPNALVINRKVFRALRLNPEVVAQVHSSGAGSSVQSGDVTIANLSAVFDLPNIIVAGGTQNTADINDAASMSQIWGNHAQVCRIAETNDMQEPCIGRIFNWAEDGSNAMGTVEMYRSDSNRSDIIRARHDVDEKKLYHEMGMMIKSVLT